MLDLSPSNVAGQFRLQSTVSEAHLLWASWEHFIPGVRAYSAVLFNFSVLQILASPGVVLAD